MSHSAVINKIRSPLFAFPVLLLIANLFLLSGCAALPVIGGSAALVPVKSIAVKIAVAAGTATLQVVLEEASGLRIDLPSLVQQLIVDDVKTGIPPTNVPILMLVSKDTNDIFYWQLTDKVKMIRLRHDQPGMIELKVINESPLRIELWIDGNIEEAIITVEMKE